MSLIISVLEVGADVVVSGSGSVNLTSLTLTSSAAPLGALANLMNPYDGIVISSGSTSDNSDTYSGFTPTTGFGTNVNSGAASSIGDLFGISTQTNDIYLPAGYSSGSPLNGSMTFTSETYTSLGLVNGSSYQYNWGTGGTADFILIQVGEPVTPTPTPTQTATPTNTVTPSATPTQTVTPSKTPTNTPTPSSTAAVTPTVTPTNTVTPTVTQTNTPTASVSPTVTPTNTVTPSVTPTNTLTPTGTPTPTPTPPGYWIITDCDGTTRIVDLVGISPTLGEMYLLQFSGSTPYGCYFIIDTSYGPSTDIGSSLGGPYVDCTECGVNYTGTSVNSFYETEGFCCESGTTSPGAAYPHPVYAAPGGVAIQLNAVALGGFNGLNN